jgi:tetratricopeptide (TPR) repeat protein
MTFLLAVLVVWSPVRAEERSGAALLIGVDRYDHYTRLRYAGPDAAALGQVLRGEFGLKVTVLSQQRAKDDPEHAPDARRVRAELKRLTERAGPADTVVFGFSGHGRQEAGGKDIYLALADCDSEDPLSRLTLGELYAAFAKCKAKQKLLILDACRRVSTGDRIDEGRPDRPKIDTKAQVPPPPPGVVVLLSCAPDEVSIESPVLGHGAFTYFVLAELRRAASQGESVTAARLATAVTAPTVALTSHRLGTAQTPQRLAVGQAEVTLQIPAARHLKAGLAAARKMQWKPAEEAFTAGLKEAPEAPRLLAERAIVRVHRGQRDGALDDAKEAVRLAPDFPAALRARAMAHGERGELAAAREAIDRAIRLDPRFAAGYLTRSAVADEQGDLARALEDAEQAVRLDPDWPEALLQRAEARHALDLDDLAVADARRALVVQPGLSQALVLLAQLTGPQVGRVEAEKLLGQALQAADAALHDDPDDLLARLYRITALALLRRHEEAEKEAKRAADRHPENGDLRGLLGGVRLLAGRPEPAVADLTAAARLVPESASPLRLRALARLRQFDRTAAAADLAAAIKLAPLDPRARWKRAELLRDDDPAAALADCDWAVAHYPNAWHAYVARARVFRRSGDPDRCLADLATAARLAPANPAPLSEKGLVLHALGRLEDAVAVFDKAIQLAPKDPTGYASRGWTHMVRKDFAKAAADFRVAVDLDPEDAHGHVHLGFALYKLDRFQEAVDVLTRAVERGSRDAEVYRHRGLASLLLGHLGIDDLVRQAEYADPQDDSSDGTHLLTLLLRSARSSDTALLDRLVKAEPDNFLYYYLRARVHQNAKRYAEALANADVLRKLHPTAPLGHVLRADVFFEQGEPTKALAEYEQAIRLAPRRPQLYYERGVLHLRTRKRAEAEADFKKAVELDPKDPEAVNQLGILHYQDGHWAEALVAFTKAVKLDPKDADYRRNRADARVALGGPADLRLAEEDYAEAIKLAPGRADLYAARGQMRLDRGHNDGAIADLTKALDLDPKNGHSRNLRGIAFYRSNRSDLAVKDFAEAIKLSHDDAVFVANRGHAYLALKDFNAAVADFRKARQMDPKNDDSADYLADALVARGQARLAAKEFGPAVADLDEALQLRPKLVAALRTRGDAHRARKALDLAAKDYTAAVEAAQGKDAFVLARRGLLAAARGDAASAAADFDKVYALAADDEPAPGGGPADDLVAAACHAEAEAWRDEVDALGRVLKAEPGVGYLHWRRGKASTALNAFDDTAADFSRSIELGFVRPAVFTDRAWVYNNRAAAGDWARALADAAHAIQLDPKGLPGHTEKAHAQLRLKEYDQAIAAATAALELAAKDRRCLEYRAQAWEAKGEWARAAADYSRAIGTGPKEAKYFHGRGRAWSELGKYAEAEADHTKAIELKSKEAGYWNHRGFARIHLGRFDEAAGDLHHAIELDPKAAAPHANLGLAALKQRNYGIAVQRLTRAVELDPKHARGFQLRAEAYQAMGELAKAEADKKKAAELNPGPAGR